MELVGFRLLLCLPIHPDEIDNWGVSTLSMKHELERGHSMENLQILASLDHYQGSFGEEGP
jgi:hypothetical protein